MSNSVWRTSSFSGTEGACVEVEIATLGKVRDSKNPDGPTLVVPGFPALVRMVKADRLG